MLDELCEPEGTLKSVIRRPGVLLKELALGAEGYGRVAEDSDGRRLPGLDDKISRSEDEGVDRL